MVSMPMSQAVQETTRQLLHEIARTSPHDVLREVIEEVMAGRTTWSGAMGVTAYREAAEDAVARTLSGAEPLGREVLARCEEAAQRYLDAFAREAGVTIADRPQRLIALRHEPC